MYYTANILVGILISILIFLNGVLAKTVGNFNSLAISHFVGFFLIAIIKFIFVKEKVVLPPKLYLYFGGVFNILNFFIQNTTMKIIGVSGTVIFIVVGQMLSSLIVDHFGLLGRSVHKIEFRKFFSLLLIIIGAIFINL